MNTRGIDRQSPAPENSASEGWNSDDFTSQATSQRSESPSRPSQRDEPPSRSESLRSSQSVPVPTMADVLKALDEARAQIAELQQERDAARPSVSREFKIGQPDHFDGKVSEYMTFMSQCELHFTVYPDAFVRGESKVLFIISFLKGNARSWAADILTQQTHPLRRDYDAFKRALDVLYLDRNLRHQARDKLSRLRQTKSATAYSVEFQQIITPLRLDNNAKCIFFYIGLKDTVKDALVTLGESEQFEELVNQVIAIDQRQHQRRMEEKKTSSNPANSDRTPKNENGKRPASAPPSRPSTPAPGPKPGHSNPGKGQPRPPVSDAEKERRRLEKLCFYCGSDKHRIEKCPSRPATSTSSATESVQLPQFSFLPSFDSEN